jgi:hypothetical protein
MKVGPFECIHIPKGKHLFYASAKFKELQIDRTLSGLPPLDFPSRKNFFISTFQHALEYSVRLGVKNMDLIHVYIATRDIYLYDIMNVDNLHYLMMIDTRSPFHINNNSRNIHNVKGLLKCLRHKYGELNPFGGFSLLLAATRCHTGSPKRDSHIKYDYILADLMSGYLEEYEIDGWYNPPEEFPEEFMVFNPSATLRPDYEHYLNRRLDIVPTIPRVAAELEGLEMIMESEWAKLQEMTRDEPEGPGLDALRERQRLFRHRVNKTVIQSLTKYAKGLYPLVRNIGSYYNRTQGKCRLRGCIDSMSFEHCQESLGNLADEMRKYRLHGDIHHVGQSVADHSIWVTRCLVNWFSTLDHPWTTEIWPELRSITLISGFTHDIGKIGDMDMVTLARGRPKRDHPHRGFMYFTGKLDFKINHAAKRVFDVIGCAYNNINITISSVVAAMHHHLGELLLTARSYGFSNVGHDKVNFPHIYNYMDYLIPLDTVYGTVLNYAIPDLKYIIFYHHLARYLIEVDHEGTFLYNRDNLEQLLYVLLAVSAADTYGAYPVDAITKTPTSQILNPQVIFQETQVHDGEIIEIMRPYYRYMYYTLGLVEKYKIIEFSRTVDDIHDFCQAWDGIQHIFRPKLPNIYRDLDQSSTDNFLTDLLRLLRGQARGNLEHRRPKTKLDVALREALLAKPESKMNLERYEKLKPKKPSKQAPF